MPRAARKSNTRSRGAAPSISELYTQFAAAVATTKAIPEPPKGVAADTAFDEAVKKCGTIAWRIVKAPAASVDEMLLKIAVAGWCIGAAHKDLAELERWQPDRLLDRNEEAYALATLRDDLHRLRTATR